VESRDGRTLSEPQPPAIGQQRSGWLPRTARGRFAAAGAVAAVGGVLLGLALHIAGPRSSSSPPLTLPSFHGEGDWAAGQRSAPPFALRDQQGRAVSLAAQRGHPVLIALLGTGGRDRSGAEAIALGEALALVAPSERPFLDVISVDPTADSAAHVRRATARWQLPQPFHWLTAPATALARALHEYDVAQAPDAPGSGSAGTPVYLVDRAGFERAGYLYPFFPTVLARDLERLYREAR
jgi:cytochrome oxidase Cu insertion factor (SCO1/SenC/PrrC family)